jgi:non-specific serine/threonine protein kinase
VARGARRAAAAAPGSGDGGTDRAFAGLVRDALAHLYDPVALRRHALAAVGGRAAGPAGPGAGRALQRELLAAVEALRPAGAGAAATARGPGRRHRLLVLRYVEALPVAAVQARLAISRAEYFREHQRAVAAVAEVLRERWAPPAGAAAAPPTPSAVAPRERAAGAHNLPRQLTSFVGRARELAEVRRLLAAVPLFTLTGAGGCGKTRLALRAAADVAAGYPDGVWLAELGALADPGLVPQAVAAAVGVREEPGRPLPATLADALREKRLLLVLDNCEHLLAAAAGLADTLLRACPRLTVLATSREALGVAGETAWRVPSLALPELLEGDHPPPAAAVAQCEAVRLFVDRAAAVRATFRVTPQNAAAVAQLCHRLDGIPLALELAAARVRVLPVAQLLGRLEDRFRLLTGGSRTAVPRHQTLRAAVDWSYALLTPDEQTLLRRLAVFAGGWTLEAAEAVGSGGGIEPAAVLELLTRLVDQSLVVVEEQPDGTARYRLLETLRQYAREKLAAGGAAAGVRGRHAAFFLSLAGAAEPELRGVHAAAWIDRLERELDNLRGALEWAAATGAAELGLRLAGALFWFWLRRHAAEGRTWLARLLGLRALRARPASALARGRALAEAGMLAWGMGELDEARRLCGEGLALARQAGDRAALAWAAYSLGHVASERGEDALARPLLEEALALYEAAGDRRGVAFALRTLAEIARRGGDDDRARAHLERALALYREVGDESGMGGARIVLGHLACEQGDHARARQAYEASLAHFRAGGDSPGGVVALEGLARLAMLQEDYAAARAAYAECLERYHQIGRRQGVGRTLEWLAAEASAQGQWERALRLAGAADTLPAPPVAGGLAPARADVQQVRAQARGALGEAAAAAGWAAGRAMSLDQAIASALEDAPDSA